jgi:hypothetical protein
MAKTSIDTVNATDTFQVWLNKTNELVALFNTDAMTASVLGDTTIGNATLVGSFTANTINAVGGLSANTFSVLSIENKDSSTADIDVTSPIAISSTERNILSITAPTGPIISLTNQFPITWNLSLSSDAQTAEFQIARGTGSAIMRLTADSQVIFDADTTINQDLTVLGEITGNASSSSILETARDITATGDLAWTVSFDGSENVSSNATIQANSVSNGKFRQSSALSVVGRTSNSTGNVADISAAADHQVLRRSGTTLGFGSIDLSQSAAVTNSLPVTNGGTGQSSFVAGRILFGGSTIGSDAALFWNNSNKRLGINTASPLHALDVTGTIRSTTVITNTSQHQAGSPTAPAVSVRDTNNGIYSSSTSTLNVTTGGTLAATFSAGGDFTAVGNVFAFSDVRLKSNIATIDNGLSKVLEMRGVEYTKDGKKSLGLIAQEVEAVLPEMVAEIEGFKTVSYGNIVAVLIEAIKDLNKEIELLKSNQKG